MDKFIIGTFLLLGFGFYQLSGGADFQPEPSPVVELAAVEVTPAAIPFNEPQVTRAAAFEIPTEAPVAEAVIIEASMEVPAIEELPVDLRAVSGSRVNMRTDPGTNYGVLDKLVRGTQAEVIEVTAEGWARIRVVETGQVGWMATSLLDAI
jgi:hypothetical protein